MRPDGSVRTVMRGYAEYKGGKLVSGGTLVFHFTDGKAVGLELYSEWIERGRPELVPGNEIPAVDKDLIFV